MTTPSYPGVYVQEIGSGVRTIAGVSTAITAFVGRAAAGPTDLPVQITSFTAYERQFGGLHLASPMSYAVRDFFTNGGSHAVIVRVLHGDASAATITLKHRLRRAAGLILEASSCGEWGNRLSAAVDHDTDRALPSGSPPATDARRFNLTVRYQPNAKREEFVTERFLSVSTRPGDARYLPLILQQESAYVRVKAPMPTTRPASTVKVMQNVRTVQMIHADTGVGSDGPDITDDDVIGSEALNTGLYALNRAPEFNLLCIPPRVRDTSSKPSAYTATSSRAYQAALSLCVTRRALLIVDPDPAWGAHTADAAQRAIDGLAQLGFIDATARNAALYFPCVRQVDPLRDDYVDTFVPSGTIAGIMARTDAQRGVWKAPAGLNATIRGSDSLQINLNDRDNDRLNRLGINCLRSMPVQGRVVWGARTLRGADAHADEYKYVPVRRLALFIEESLYRGTMWTVFEPNDEPLWVQLRLDIGNFMHGLFQQGALQGATPREAYFVKCDSNTNSASDISIGLLNIMVGFAPLRPAEFVVLRIQLKAGPGGG